MVKCFCLIVFYEGDLHFQRQLYSEISYEGGRQENTHTEAPPVKLGSTQWAAVRTYCSVIREPPQPQNGDVFAERKKGKYTYHY